MTTIISRKWRLSWAVPLVAVLVGTPAALRAAASSQANELAALIRNHGAQGRAFMVEDPILSAVAQVKAQDMADRSYFSHVDPDGLGPNELVRRAGYELPSWYDTSLGGNNIESLSAGYTTPSAAFAGWLDSPGHKMHVLAESDFYREQTSYGVGYVHDPTSPYLHYWVFLSAPPQPGAPGGLPPAPDYFAEATPLGDGWYSSDALGFFWREDGSNWAWSNNLLDWFYLETGDSVLWTFRFGALTATGEGAVFTHEALWNVYTGEFNGWVWSSRVGWVSAYGGGWYYSTDLGWLVTNGAGVWSISGNGWL